MFWMERLSVAWSAAPRSWHEDKEHLNPRVHLASFHKKEWKEVEKEEKEKQAKNEKANKSAEKTSQPKIKSAFFTS